MISLVVAEIMTALAYLKAHPEIKHCEIRVGFGPDEEIGIGADKFDVEDFDVDFAYTVDGGPLGELQYETFSAAGAELTFHGRNVHPGTAKDQMVNALQLAIDFHNQLPAEERPELTDGYQGFNHLQTMTGTVEEAKSSYIIRDFETESFENRKATFQEIADQMNQAYGLTRVDLVLKDQYYNMRQVIEKDMTLLSWLRVLWRNWILRQLLNLFVAELTGLKFHSWAFQLQTYLLVAKICMVVMSLFPCRQWKKP